jgi:hypothetical protein
MNIALWIVQGLMAALFIFAGGFRFTMPIDELEALSGLPGAFILFISACEVLGGLGLILPGITRIKTGLTPLAAAGLTIIMIGAVVLTAAGVGGADAILATIPGVVGLLTAFVAYGRWRVRPHGQPSPSSRAPATAEAAA